jgi:hypothetical protein
MADQDSRTKVVFSGGGEVLIGEEVAVVRGKLIEGGTGYEPFPGLPKPNGGMVYVNAAQVAYVEQAEERDKQRSAYEERFKD